MKKYFWLLIAIIGLYYLYSGFTGAETEAMNLSSEITYDTYTDFIPDTDCYWGYRAGKVLHYTADGINDFTISVNAAQPVISVGDLLTVYDEGKDELYGYDRHGEELWEYKAGGSIEDVKTSPGENIFMVYLKDSVHHMAEINGKGAKLNDWVASDDYVMDYDFSGDTVYVASANTSDKLGGRITAYNRSGDLIWSQELAGQVPLMIRATDEGVSAILDKKVLAVSAKGKMLFEKELKADYGCIGEDGDIFAYAEGNLYGQAMDGRSLFKVSLPGVERVYPEGSGVLALAGRTVSLYGPDGRAEATYDAMKDIDYLVPMKGKGKILAVGRSGADLITLPQGGVK